MEWKELSERQRRYMKRCKSTAKSLLEEFESLDFSHRSSKVDGPMTLGAALNSLSTYKAAVDKLGLPLEIDYVELVDRYLKNSELPRQRSVA